MRLQKLYSVPATFEMSPTDDGSFYRREAIWSEEHDCGGRQEADRAVFGGKLEGADYVWMQHLEAQDGFQLLIPRLPLCFCGHVLDYLIVRYHVNVDYGR